MKVLLIRSKTTDSAVFKIANTLNENGYEVELLVWDRQQNFDSGDCKYSIHTFDLKSPYDSFWAVLYLPLWWLYEFYFLITNDYDVVHVCDLDTLWPAVITKQFKGFKLFYTIYDFYASLLPDGNFQFIRNVVRMLVGSIEKLGIRFADTLFLVDESRYEQVKGAKIDKLVYIYNSPVDKFSDQTLKINENSEKDIKIFYGGSLEKDRGLKYVVAAVKELSQIKLVIAGLGSDKEFIEKEANKNEKIYYRGWMQYNELIAESLSADILFAFYNPRVPNNKYASPNKLFEAMMCGKPIIMNSETSSGKIVKDNELGILVNFGDVVSLKNAIIKLRDNPDIRKKFGINGRKTYEKQYNWKIMENRLLDAYKSIKKEI